VLGVARDATPEQIKAAFRAAARRTHPDKNADKPQGEADAAMAAINKAWEVLGDPERRAAYDKDGTDDAAHAIEEDGRMQITELFDRAATDETIMDVVKHVGNVLRSRIADCEAEVRMAHKLITQLKRARGRVRHKKGGTNLFHAIVDKKIANVEKTIPQNQRLMRVVHASLKILADYECVDDAFEIGRPPALAGDRRTFLPWGRFG